MDPAEVLASASIFRGSSPDDFATLATQTRTRTFAKDEYLWHVGDRADAMLVLLSGELQITRTGIDGDEFVVEIYLAGDAVGQLPFFDENPVRVMDMRAARLSEVLWVARAAVLEHLQGHPALMLRMLEAYSRWIRQRDVSLADMAFQNLSGRVACKLLELLDLYGRPHPDGYLIDRELPQHELAAMVGASRENVNRALQRLARQRDVLIGGRRLVVPDPAELRRRYGWWEPPEWARLISPRPAASSRHAGPLKQEMAGRRAASEPPPAP